MAEEVQDAKKDEKTESEYARERIGGEKLFGITTKFRDGTITKDNEVLTVGTKAIVSKSGKLLGFKA